MNQDTFDLLFSVILDALDDNHIEHDASIIDCHLRAMLTEMEAA